MSYRNVSIDLLKNEIIDKLNLSPIQICLLRSIFAEWTEMNTRVLGYSYIQSLEMLAHQKSQPKDYRAYEARRIAGSMGDFIADQAEIVDVDKYIEWERHRRILNFSLLILRQPGRLSINEYMTGDKE